MNFVPSLENVAPKSNAGPVITGDCLAVSGSTAKMSPSWLDMRMPFRAGPNGAGKRVERDPTATMTRPARAISKAITSAMRLG